MMANALGTFATMKYKNCHVLCLKTVGLNIALNILGECCEDQNRSIYTSNIIILTYQLSKK